MVQTRPRVRTWRRVGAQAATEEATAIFRVAAPAVAVPTAGNGQAWTLRMRRLRPLALANVVARIATYSS
jgi:hypothetical protein